MGLEYSTSWALEKLFKARWWDYSNIPLNIGGRTSVPTSITFGTVAILVEKFMIPLVYSGLSMVSCSAPRCQDTISKILSYIFLPSFVSF